MSNKISALVVALALSGIMSPCFAQSAAVGAGTGGAGNSGGNNQQTLRTAIEARLANVRRMEQQQQQQQQQQQGQAAAPNMVEQGGQQQPEVERQQAMEAPRNELPQGINPGLVSELRARMRQAGGIGNYQPNNQMNRATTNPDNMDAAYGRQRMFAELMHQHAVLTQPYAGGN